MNRKNLTAAVLAGLAGAAGIVGSAQAVNINPDGLGQVLIYPYYTTNGGNVTLLSVVNTTDYAKAVKVRFKEGQNSREVLDFNLYLSAYDVWTASIWDDAGVPTMSTSDLSCTVPYFIGTTNFPDDGSQEFLPWAMNDTGVEGVYRPISDAAEGYFEMIEMGTIEAESDTEGFVTHVDGVPGNCEALILAWSDPSDLVNDDDGYWFDSPTVDLTDPSGGLFGGAAIVNVNKGRAFSYDAKAIDGFAGSLFGPAPTFAPLHNTPGDSTPSLNSGDQMTGNVFVQGEVLSSFGLSRGVDAVSFVFMHDQLMNEYTTEGAPGFAATEWVVTFPTKAFYTYAPESGSALPLAPFTSTWNSTTGACEVVGLNSIWDREEQTLPEDIIIGDPSGPIVSPPPPLIPNPDDLIIPFDLCYEVSVIRFGGPMASIPEVDPTTEILGSSLFHSINNMDDDLQFENGWVRLELDDYTLYTLNGENLETEHKSRDELGGLQGLPVTGFAVQSFTNSFLGDGNDVLANYGALFGHKATRKLGSLID